MEQVKDPLTKELEAMAVIGRVLGDLTDPTVRARVLRWAAERFAVETTASSAQPVPAVAATTAASADSDLSIDSLTEIFEPATPAPVPVSEICDEKLPLDRVVRSFADEFRAFAEEWNGAAA